MKINCQSCGAKYTIADEKVRGRTVKIRCKKCSSAIVVKGPEDMPPPDEEEEEDDATRVYSGGEVPEGIALSIPPQGADPGWMVTLDDGAQREGSIEELRAMYEAGTIHDDSYVWRDGMGDWQTLADTPELQSALRGRGGRSSPPRPTRSGAPSPDAKLGGGLFGGGGAAARVDTRGRDQDLFGAPAQRPPEEEVATSAPSNPMAKPVIPKFTAERGENSVLFTIDTMKAMGNQPSRPKPASVAPGGDDKIDIGALASVAPPPMSGGDFDQMFDPGPGFGAGGGFGGGGGGSLAAPMLPTTIEPEPIPEPEPMQYQGSFEPQAKSNKGIIIGLGAAVALLLVVSLAFGGYVLFGKGEEPVAANSATTAGDKIGADTDKDTTDKDTTDDDKKDDDKKDDEAKDDDKKTDAGDEKADDKKDDKTDDKKDDVKAAGTPTIGGPLPTSTVKKDDAKKDDAKKDDAKKDDPKDEPKAPAATADRKFSRSAAISALGAAAGAASGCKKEGGPTGRGRVSVTFAPSGRVTTAVVNGAPFAGTSVGGCVAAAFRRASVPPFDGSPVTVHKSFSIN